MGLLQPVTAQSAIRRMRLAKNHSLRKKATSYALPAILMYRRM